MNLDQLIIELQKLQHEGHGALPVTYPDEAGHFDAWVCTHEVITEVNVTDGKYVGYPHLPNNATMVKEMEGPHILLEWN